MAASLFVVIYAVLAFRFSSAQHEKYQPDKYVDRGPAELPESQDIQTGDAIELLRENKIKTKDTLNCSSSNNSEMLERANGIDNQPLISTCSSCLLCSRHITALVMINLAVLCR